MLEPCRKRARLALETRETVGFVRKRSAVYLRALVGHYHEVTIQMGRDGMPCRTNLNGQIVNLEKEQEGEPRMRRSENWT